MELKQPNRFTISQLKAIMHQISSLTQPSGHIDSQTLLQFFNQRTVNSLSRDELPEDWRAKDFKAYQKLIKNLDREAKGYVPVNIFLSYLCLLSTHLPKEDDILEYQTDLVNNSQNGWINRQDFIESRAFFDAYESSPHTEPNSEPFLRVQLLKDILFDINKDHDKDIMDANEYIRVITAYSNIAEEAKIKAENIYVITESPLRSPGKSPGRKSTKKNKKEVIKTYTNVLFD